MKDRGFIILRRKANIIQFQRYNIIQDEVNFYREQFMFSVAWRNLNFGGQGNILTFQGQKNRN